MDETRSAAACIVGNEMCEGVVDYRMPLPGRGSALPRCEKHWQERFDLEDGVRRRYQGITPPDFDPTYAGESWEEP